MLRPVMEKEIMGKELFSIELFGKYLNTVFEIFGIILWTT